MSPGSSHLSPFLFSYFFYVAHGRSEENGKVSGTNPTIYWNQNQLPSQGTELSLNARILKIEIKNLQSILVFCFFFLNFRNPSPKPVKRKSCPDVSPDVRGIVVRSMTIDNVPEFSLPPERIQPRSGYDSIQSPTKQHSAHSFVGHVQPDLYKWVALAGNLALFAYYSKQCDLRNIAFYFKRITESVRSISLQ